MLPKYPKTLHLEDSKGERDPKAASFGPLFKQFLVVEEKMDGSMVSIFFDESANLHFFHRNQPVKGEEFDQLKVWAQNLKNELFDTLSNRYVLYGEWLYATHTVFYDKLSDFFLEYDIYDSQEKIWLSTRARKQLLSHLPIQSVKILAQGTFTEFKQIKNLLGPSVFASIDRSKPQASYLDSSGMAEGLYIKHENDQEVLARYKYIRPEFIKILLQSPHWKDREMIRNKLK
jgi:hypothetical protein